MTPRELLINMAYDMAVTNGFESITRDGVADSAGLARGAVNHHFTTMDGLRDEVMRSAIERVNLAIIGHGLAIRHPVAMTAPDDVKRQALDTLL